MGVRAYQVGMAYLRHTSLQSLEHPVLSDIRDRLKETCCLAVEDNGEFVYLDKLESDAPVFTYCRVGSRNKPYCTGLGKAILAAWSDAYVPEKCPGPYEMHTPNTIPDVETLITVLAGTRERGYATGLGEDIPYTRIYDVLLHLFMMKKAMFLPQSVYPCLMQHLQKKKKRLRQKKLLMQRYTFHVNWGIRENYIRVN